MRKKKTKKHEHIHLEPAPVNEVISTVYYLPGFTVNVLIKLLSFTTIVIGN